MILLRTAAASFLLLISSGELRGSTASPPQDPQQVVEKLVARELKAGEEKRLFAYTAFERSDRSAGHLWTEYVAETSQGNLRYLVAEDGKPLSPARHEAELRRLKNLVDDPADFLRHEEVRKKEEQHARELLALLPRAFLFSAAGEEKGYLRIHYVPRADYSPQSYEERVLHEVSGDILVDSQTGRLRSFEGHLTKDVSFGYGLLATIHSGSRFSNTRSPVSGDHWKTTLLDIHVNGRVILLKTIARNQESVHQDFHPLPAGLSLREAVDYLEHAK